MMAEGQGNGNDSPERDAGGGPGAGTPEAETDPGAGGQASPGASWFPFKMTSPAEEAGLQAPGTPAAPAGPSQPGPGQQPLPRESGTPPYQQTQPLGGLSSPWLAARRGLPWRGQPAQRPGLLVGGSS